MEVLNPQFLVILPFIVQPRGLLKSSVAATVTVNTATVVNLILSHQSLSFYIQFFIL
jgi:hypothetical protein